MLELVYHICFSPNYFWGKPREYEEQLITQACCCLREDMIPPTSTELTRTPAVLERAINSFGTKRIAKRCTQIVNLTTRGRHACGQTFIHGLRLAESLYASSTLNKSFFDQKLHVAIIQGYWHVQKEDSRAMQSCAWFVILYVFRYILLEVP